MQKTRTFFEQMFYFLGDRVALLGLLFVGAVIFVSQQVPFAFSDTKSIDPSPTSMPIPQVETFAPTSTPSPTFTPTPTPTNTPTPTPTATPAPTADPTNDSIWDQLAACESNNHWNDDTGNGYYGGLQFNQTAWASVGGNGNPSSASREEQISRGKLLQARRGWSPWGACARKLGLD